ncbi:hypothetical protein RAA17_13505 [Komagataeibacter rhaeticus]|nr:hypothetical protein [Komagataeibacter rhaeticus]
MNFNAEQLWSGWMSYHDPALRVSRDKFHLLNAAVMNACASPVGKSRASWMSRTGAPSPRTA